MFSSWPLKFNPRLGSSRSGEESTDSGSPRNTLSSPRLEHDFESPAAAEASLEVHDMALAAAATFDQKQQPQDHMESGSGCPRINVGVSHARATAKQSSEKRKSGSGSNTEKALDPKTLRRLAQNREAARKSRLRKKAYVQQLESSRIRLTQLEQDLQRARSQGLFLGGGVTSSGSISSGGAVFDMGFSRWLDDDQGHMSDLRAALQADLGEGDLGIIVDQYVTHYDEIFQLRGAAAKADVFHVITGMWASPVERSFLWMGGFRPSQIIKMLASQLEQLTEQQVVSFYSLRQSTQQAEEALSQGLDQLHQSLVDTIANASTSSDHMHHMVVAVGKITSLEGFVCQADNLRQQTLHQLRRVLTIRQVAQCFLTIGEFYGRLRALSSLWASRPRESFITTAKSNSCQMAQLPHNHFSSSF